MIFLDTEIDTRNLTKESRLKISETFTHSPSLQVWVFSNANFEGFLHNLTRTFKIFESLVAILEPICFVMADATS